MSLTTISNAQIKGKTFEGEVGYTCKKMANGGCAITSYCVLIFHKNESKVDIYKYAVAACTPKSREKAYAYNEKDNAKTYNWVLKGNILSINAKIEHNKFTVVGDKLIFNLGKENTVEFIEKIN